MANFEILALDPTTPQIRAPGAGDGYSVPRDMTFATGTTLNAPTTVVSVNTSTDALRITQVGSGNALLVEDSANPDASPTAITATGAVGIGTATPSTVLHVKGTAGGTDPTVVTGERVRIQSNDTTGRSTYMSLIAGTSANSGVLFGDQDAADVGQIRYLHTDNSMQFHVSSAEVARFDSSGNLGIGTTSPVCKLQVETASASSDIVGCFRQSTNPVAYIKSGSGYAAFGQGATSGETRIMSDGGGTAFVSFYTGTGTEKARLTSGGDLGIGTTSPGAKLSVDGSAIFNDSGADVDFRVESDTNTHALFVDAGNSRVGINNSTPAVALDVTGDIMQNNAVKVYADDNVAGVTATTGTITFSFDASGGATKVVTLIKISFAGLSDSNNVTTDTCFAEYIFGTLAYSTGGYGILSPTVIYEHNFDATTDFASASTGNTSFTVTLTNPLGETLNKGGYKVEIIGEADSLSLTSVTYA